MLLNDEERPETTEELGSRGNKASPNEIFQVGVEAGVQAQLEKDEDRFEDELRIIVGTARSYEQYTFLINELRQALKEGRL